VESPSRLGVVLPHCFILHTISTTGAPETGLWRRAFPPPLHLGPVLDADLREFGSSTAFSGRSDHATARPGVSECPEDLCVKGAEMPCSCCLPFGRSGGLLYPCIGGPR
jgi:hypothetical protein